jgi:hypothetical protein
MSLLCSKLAFLQVTEFTAEEMAGTLSGLAEMNVVPDPKLVAALGRRYRV